MDGSFIANINFNHSSRSLLILSVVSKASPVRSWNNILKMTLETLWTNEY